MNPSAGVQAICELYDPILPAPNASTSVTVPPAKIVALARFTVSVSDPVAPVAVEMADPEVPESEPVMSRAVVSPTAAFTHSLRRVSDADLRVLVIVHVTGSGAAGPR